MRPLNISTASNVVRAWSSHTPCHRYISIQQSLTIGTAVIGTVEFGTSNFYTDPVVCLPIMVSQPSTGGTDSSERCCVFSVHKAGKWFKLKGRTLKTLHCWMTVTSASLRRKKLKKMHQTVSLSRQREMWAWCQCGTDSVWCTHANVPLADMTEGEFFRISSIHMAGYFMLFLYTHATKHADWVWVVWGATLPLFFLLFLVVVFFLLDQIYVRCGSSQVAILNATLGFLIVPTLENNYSSWTEWTLFVCFQLPLFFHYQVPQYHAIRVLKLCTLLVQSNSNHAA